MGYQNVAPSPKASSGSISKGCSPATSLPAIQFQRPAPPALPSTLGAAETQYSPAGNSTTSPLLAFATFTVNTVLPCSDSSIVNRSSPIFHSSNSASVSPCPQAGFPNGAAPSSFHTNTFNPVINDSI